MSKIRILPEQLANQIAAGEVVERPASVVKELLENCLDAGSTRIEIEIEGGGTRLIRIIDNGEGMDEDDLLLCLERHGTSKIRDAEDLTTINTLGFRGEAIPSIGSVSNMSISSRVEGSTLGTQAVVKYGKLQSVHEIGCSRGTIIEIRNLFGNTPARRKFLRTVRTELGHIEEVVKNYSLASPDVTFILRINEKEVLHLDGSLPIESRLKTLMNYQGEFLEIGTAKIKKDRGLHGFLVPPAQPLSGSAKLRLFVNGRAIKDRMLTHAVAEGLRGFLMKGKYPAGLLHVTLPPEEIDVNVHPAKHEIRFRNSRDVHTLVTTAVMESMKNHQGNIQSNMFGGTTQIVSQVPLDRDPFSHVNDSYVSIPPSENQISQVKIAERETPYTTINRDEEVVTSQTVSETIAPVSISKPGSSKQSIEQLNLKTVETDFEQDVGQKVAIPAVPHVDTPQTETVSISPPTPQNQGMPTISPPSGNHDLQIIGQLNNLYILCQNEHGLLVIDQHAAHERLLFEELRTQFLTGNLVSQSLLFPETVELSIFQTQLVEKNIEQLERMGFSIRDFGGNSFVISAIPALAGQTGASALFYDILDQFGSENNRSSSGANRLDDILASLACKAAVKAGHALSHIEIEALLKRMAKADLFSHCPHGRPVLKQFNQSDIKKWFHRT